MSPEQRITKIEEFVHVQPYLRGLMFLVKAHPRTEDVFVIEFAKANTRQLSTLRHRLRLNGMFHIECSAREVIQFEETKKKKK